MAVSAVGRQNSDRSGSMASKEQRDNSGSLASTFVGKVADNIFGSLISLTVGAIVTTAIFFFTSHVSPLEKLKQDMRSEVIQRLRNQGLAKQPDQIDFDFIDSYKLSLTSDTAVLRGKFEPLKNYDGSPPRTKNALFLAIFEESSKSLLDNIAGRDGEKKLTALLTFRGYAEPQVSNLRVEDVFGKGEKAILFEIFERYGDGRGISPIILYKYANDWKPTLLQNFDHQAQTAMDSLIKDKSIKPSTDFLQDLRGPRPPEASNITFLEDWELDLNGQQYKFVTLRNSSGFKYEQNPAYGYRNALVVASYRDDTVLAPHRIYVRALKLAFADKGSTWENDETWNGGKALVSVNAVHFDTLNFDELFNGGFQKINHANFYGVSFGKE